jgi:hypothetical protein
MNHAELKAAADAALPYYEGPMNDLVAEYVDIVHPITILKLIAVAESSAKLREFLIDSPTTDELDIPNEIWNPFSNALKELNDD